MNKIALLLIAAASFSACKKDTSTTLSKTDILVSREWVITQAILGNEDIFSATLECFKDDVHQFQSDGTYIVSEGEKSCYPTDPLPPYHTKWEFLDNETKIKLDAQENHVVELTPFRLVVMADYGGKIGIRVFAPK